LFWKEETDYGNESECGGDRRKVFAGNRSGQPNAHFSGIEEAAFLDKRVVETGKVRISKRISEREELIDEPLFREEVTVERVPINQYVDQPPQVRHEGDVMIIPVVQEQLVMQNGSY
jgi:stress response protein YsnF